jgi:hypothetical protein
MSFNIVPVAEADVLTLVKSIDKVIINPIIIFLFAVAMVYFLYGVAQYLLASDNEEVRSKSKSHMMWGVIGLFIMVAVFGIMRILLNTFGETKIQVNSNGDFNVTGTTLNDTPVANNPGTGGDLFKPGSVDVSTNTDSPALGSNQYITSPFPMYEAHATTCWSNISYSKAGTEFNALELVKANAKTRYLSASGMTSLQADKLGYPKAFETKVLYDKTGKIYYAWLDSRAPIGTGTMTDCNLKVLAPAPTLPASIVFSQSDVSSATDTANLPQDVYTSSPFPTFEAKPAVCWNNGNSPFLAKGSTEFNALELVKANARKKYLSDNNISVTDSTKANYPVIFESKVLYDKKAKIYYAWLDSRAPIGTGKMTDCNLKVVTPARAVPDSIVFSQVDATGGVLNLSGSTTDNNIADYTKSPFKQKYIPNNLCWREQIYNKANTEFEASSQVKFNARLDYLSASHLTESTAPQNLPTVYGSFTAYDKVNKVYYVWLDVRAPIGAGSKASDCNLAPDGAPITLQEPTARSAKPNPLSAKAQTSKDSNDSYYRVIDSGADNNYFVARNIAINNALIQIAKLKGLDSITDITSKTIVEEKYYPQDPYTLNFDYWVAIESPK